MISKCDFLGGDSKHRKSAADNEGNTEEEDEVQEGD